MSELAEEKKRMTIMRSMYDLVKRRETRKGKEAAYDLIMMMVEYGLNGVVPDENNDLYDSFIIISPVINNSNERSEWGKMGGKGNVKGSEKLPLDTSKLPLDTSKLPLEPSKVPLYEVGVGVGVGVGVEEGVGVGVGGQGGVSLQKPTKQKSSSKRFEKPTFEEIAQYCAERNNGIDAQKFFDHYEMIGWVVGKSRTPMVNWQSAVRTWETRDRERMDEGIRQTSGQQVSPFDPSNLKMRERRPVDAD